jgi:hypothetical protein
MRVALTAEALGLGSFAEQRRKFRIGDKPSEASSGGTHGVWCIGRTGMQGD